MADKIKDAEDELLESLFAVEPVADDGFSARVVTRVRRRLWIRRLSLPIAVTIGGFIAYEPLVSVISAVSGLLQQTVPTEYTALSLDALPSMNMLMIGGMILAAAMLGFRLLED